MDKPPRTFWQIWNMSFGFLGIQFGWGSRWRTISVNYDDNSRVKFRLSSG